MKTKRTASTAVLAKIMGLVQADLGGRIVDLERSTQTDISRLELQLDGIAEDVRTLIKLVESVTGKK